MSVPRDGKRPVSPKKAPPRKKSRSRPPSSYLGYLCKGCDLEYLSERHIWEDPDGEFRKPVSTRPRTKSSPLWWECRRGGPRFGIFGKRKDPPSARYRLTFDICGQTAVVCTPCGPRISAGPDGHRFLSFGPLLTEEELRRQWYLKKVVTANKERSLDLEHFSRLGSCVISQQDGRFELIEAGAKTIAEWQTKVEVLYGDTFGSHRTPLQKLAAALGGLPEPGNWQEARRSLVWVPIDMRRPVSTQLKEIASPLAKAAEFLHAAADRHAATRPQKRAETVWRDIYIYLSSSVKRLDSAAIVAEVFPTGRATSAASKVRGILTRVRRVAAAVGFPKVQS